MGSGPCTDSVGSGKIWKGSVLMWLRPAREHKRETLGQFSDREFDTSPGLVAGEENARRLLMGIAKHRCGKGTGWGDLRLYR